MGLFRHKALYKYEMLERFKIDIKKFRENAEEGEHCTLIGETNLYNIYVIRQNSSGSREYILRQEKIAPKKVVYLGSAKDHRCVYKNKVFMIDKTTISHNHADPSLIVVDVETAQVQKIGILSEKTIDIFVASMIHRICQDTVEAISVSDDGVMLKVSRYKEGTYERIIGVKTDTYNIYITIENGKLNIRREYPNDMEVNKSSVVWRNTQGKIVCSGDDCPQECDDTCPIWLNTKGLKLSQINQFEKAVESFKKALEIAPDFIDAQNNMGTSYGMAGQHKEAYEAFLAAHKMNPKYPKALSGLIIAEKHLGMKAEALKHCDEYDALPGCNADEFRDSLQDNTEDKETSASISYVAIAAHLLNYGRDKGFVVSEGLPHVPELLVQSERTCLLLLKDICDYGEEHPDANVPRLTCAWAAFAGMGGVYQWHVNWNMLSQTGLFEALTKDRGVFEMDEYVLDSIGVGYGSEKGRELVNHIMNAANLSLGIARGSHEGLAPEVLMEAAKAMFIYGMVYELNRIGML